MYPFERFTKGTKKVLTLAQEESTLIASIEQHPILGKGP
jgi:hypothetical protein